LLLLLLFLFWFAFFDPGCLFFVVVVSVCFLFPSCVDSLAVSFEWI
jgi:hypothetical protein